MARSTACATSAWYGRSGRPRIVAEYCSMSPSARRKAACRPPLSVQSSRPRSLHGVLPEERYSSGAPCQRASASRPDRIQRGGSPASRLGASIAPRGQGPRGQASRSCYPPYRTIRPINVGRPKTGGSTGGSRTARRRGAPDERLGPRNVVMLDGRVRLLARLLGALVVAGAVVFLALLEYPSVLGHWEDESIFPMMASLGPPLNFALYLPGQHRWRRPLRAGESRLLHS